MQTHSPYFANFYARLVVSQLTPGMLKVFCSRYRRAVDGSGTAAEMREFETLDKAIEHIKPRCMPEHEASGIKFLLGKILTPKGNLRQTDHAKEFGQKTSLFLQSHKRDMQIHLVGTNWVPGPEPNVQVLAPLYRVSAPAPLRFPGSMVSFDYTATSWQSGGYFEIRNREVV